MNAIEADSQFLSSKFVMDYSLLCGFDQVNNKIVVGIIGNHMFTFLLIIKFLAIIKNNSFKKRLSPRVHLGQKGGNLFENDQWPRQNADHCVARGLPHTFYKRDRSLFSRSTRSMVPGKRLVHC